MRRRAYRGRSIIGRRHAEPSDASRVCAAFGRSPGIERIRSILGLATFDHLDADDLPFIYDDSEQSRNEMLQPDQHDAAVIGRALRYGLRCHDAPETIDPGGNVWDWEFDEEWGRERNGWMQEQVNAVCGRGGSSKRAVADLDVCMPVGYRDEPPADWDFRLPATPCEVVVPAPGKVRAWTKERREAAAEQDKVRTDWADVVASLETQRAQLDAAIAALKHAIAVGAL